MEQFIAAMDEWYNELVEEQRAATPEVASQLRYVLTHIADARRIVKRLVHEAEKGLSMTEKEGWDAFVEHVNSKPNRRAVDEPAVAKVKWQSDEPTAVDDVMPSHPLSDGTHGFDSELHGEREVHGDDAR